MGDQVTGGANPCRDRPADVATPVAGHAVDLGVVRLLMRDYAGCGRVAAHAGGRRGCVLIAREQHAPEHEDQTPDKVGGTHTSPASVAFPFVLRLRRGTGDDVEQDDDEHEYKE